MPESFEIQIDDLTGPEIVALIQEHLDSMAAISPPESIHALDLDALRAPDITFWTVWNGSHLSGCGALKKLDGNHAEIKSMRTSNTYRRKGVAHILLEHILHTAQESGYTTLSLETGSQEAFNPARTLYTQFGFKTCAPFADYKEDPNSVFMSKTF